ncbi:Tripartite tricarboxylate transporter TctB family protein [Tindallia magadiensis]|uniref:Tripartite tricarboxylate transporter TctB family protein n=1 Tax=Tindallia magadiensis TaxID=69895 RepID=A0A1I3GK81_9FIRM|nr:tripartite tricarboxylate transporter TctB family protein [Tindallia magadiensis]SFI23853.1 Tripartite tricarboxylate transporter TctB family protein [Tindallia magadiensis]
MITNILLGVVWVAFSMIAYTQLGSLPAQSAMFPRMTILGMGAAGVLLIIDTLWKYRKGRFKSETTLTKETLIFQILIPATMLFVTYFMLRAVGFYISSFFLVVVVFLYQTYRAGGVYPKRRQVVKSLGVGGLITGTMYVIFTLLLRLPVPNGSLF